MNYSERSKIYLLSKRFLLLFGLVAALVLAMVPVNTSPAAALDGQHATNIYFFWGEGCPHCAKAKPFLDQLDRESDAIQLHSFEVYYNAENQDLFQKVGEKLQINSSGVPLIVIGDEPFIGYAESYASSIESRAQECTENGCSDDIAGIVGVINPIV